MAVTALQEQVFLALRVSTELESLLRARGAVGEGLGKLVRSLGDELPVELRSRLMALATIRNRVAHNPEGMLQEHLERFVVEAEDCKEHLLALQGGHEQVSPVLQEQVWLTRELRQREAQTSFSPSLASDEVVLDVRDLDRVPQRRALMSSVRWLLLLLVALLVFLLVLLRI